MHLRWLFFAYSTSSLTLEKSPLTMDHVRTTDTTTRFRPLAVNFHSLILQSFYP